jgi:peptidyl-tRNA hydrolase, PTH1 family
MLRWGRAGAERRSTPFEMLVIGLGNPGREYTGTRHNVGEQTVDVLARRAGTPLRAGRDQALVSETRIADRRLVLAFPTTFMNESGRAAGALVRRYGIDDPGDVIVVHDELDLEPGVVRVKVGGGLAGHNGLRSITRHLHTQDYVRVRIGVGKPPNRERGADHVLSRVSASDRQVLDEAVSRAADAVEVIVSQGTDAAMQQFNQR